jgi:hypothetical protein
MLPKQMIDTMVEYLFVLQYIDVVFDMDMKREDVRIRLNDETKLIKKNSKFSFWFCCFT